MNCPWCGYHAPNDARYCGDCGRSFRLDAVCAACGARSPSVATFCDSCGARLGESVQSQAADASLPGPPPRAEEETVSRRDAPPAAATIARRPLVGSTPLALAGLLLVAIGQLSVRSAGPGSGPPGLGLAALALGIGLFGLGSYFTVADGARSWRPERMDAPWRVFRGARALVPAAIGGVAMLVLLGRLASDPSAGGALALWVVAIVAFAVPFAARVKRLPVPPLRALAPDIALVALLVAVFLALNVQDLGDWYYAAIGDEYAFYDGATRVLDEGIERPFNQDGVYGHSPVLNSVYQALVMTVFGRDNFGWRFASVLSVAVAVPGIYIIGLTLGDRRVAVVAATFFASSHYLIAYSHTGYNTIHSLAPTIWALAFFILGLRRGSAVLLYVAGAIAGLGFYTHFAGRAALPIMALFVLVQPEWRRRVLELWPLGLAFATVAAPMFVVNKGQVLSVMLSQIAGGYAEEITGPLGQRLLTNISKNLPAIDYNPESFHYVSGPLMDPVTAFSAALGIGLALGLIREPSNRLLLAWLVVAFATTGLLAPYPQVAISRLSFVVPPLVLLGGCAAVHLWDRLPAYRGLSRRVWTGRVLLVGLALVVLGLNVRQFWFETPRSFHLTREAVAIGAMRSDACGGDVERTVFAGRHTEPLLRPALSSYYPEVDGLWLLDYQGVEADLPAIGLSARCVIFLNPAETGAGEVMDALARRYPGGQRLSFSDRSGKTTVAMFALKRD